MSAPPINPYAPPQATEAPPHRPPSQELFTYRPLGGFARVIIVGLVVMMASDLAWALDAQAGVALMERAEGGMGAEQVPHDDLVAYDRRSEALIWLRVLGMVVVVVGFCLFLPRANRNARSFGCSALEFTPRWAAGVFFVPVVNLYKPYLAVKELWQACETNARVAWQFAPTPILLKLWWGGFLIMCLISHLVGRMSDGDGPASAFLLIRQYACLVSIVAAVLCLLMVRQLTARFSQRYQRLQAVESLPADG